MTLAMTHRFLPPEVVGLPPLLLLHGTGGNEDDLLPLARLIAPGAAVLAPRGPVEEGGMPRFFRRLEEGRFDPADVRQGAQMLAAFIEAAQAAYGLPAPVAVGFSNGANVAAAVLALRPGLLAGAVLLRPMLVLEDAASGLDGTPVLMLSGTADSIVPPGSAEAVATLLAAGGAEVVHRRLPAGHGLVPGDVAAAREFVGRFAAPR